MDKAGKLVIIVAALGGLFVVFIPVVIIIMILASIGGMDDKAEDPCYVPGEAGKTMVRFQYPVPDQRNISREYAPGDDEDDPPDHAGIDFSTAVPKDVVAAADGTVIEADKEKFVVKIQHADGFQSWYLSLNSVTVDKDKPVKSGDKIGTTGTSLPEFTSAAGAHLHFEIHGDATSLDKPGKAIDPKSTIETGQEAIDAGCTCGAGGEFYSKIPEPWRGLIQKTSAEYPNVDARLVAATLWAENRGWPTYRTTGWATSSAAAQGPWQFIPSTWESMKTDGNGDGKMDPNDPADEVHAAFKHQEGSKDKPILAGAKGNVEEDFKNVPFHRSPKDNLMAFMANYNGSGAPEDQVISSFPIGDQNSDYVRMGYWLIATDFKKGYLPETQEFVDATKQGEGAGGSGGQNSGDDGASAGCAAGGPIVDTAKGLAWPEDGHGPNEGDAKPEYVAALRKHNPGGEHNDQPFSDCGVFVATVMRMTGADPDYPPVGTGNQLPYVRSHPEKYEVFENLGEGDIDKLQPGDIFIYSSSPYGHTFIYTGPYKGADGQQYDSVGASLHGHVPEAVNHEFTSYRGDQYTVARPKGGSSDPK